MRSFFTVLLAVVLSVLVVKIMDGGSSASHGESAFDRVMRTGVLRCGYYVFPPVTYRDPNTKELSGFSVDMMNEIGKRAGLKIEWTEEVNFSNWVQALQNNRFDAACTPMWPEITLARAVMFTTPMMYAGLHPLIRANDQKLLHAPLERFNRKDVRIVTQDGNTIDGLARAVFPNATINAMPTSMDGPSLMEEIKSNKSDLILLDKNGEIMYNKGSPGMFKLRDDLPPVKIQAFTLAVGRGQSELKYFLDNAVTDLLNDGSMDRIITKWEPAKGTFLRVAKPSE